MNISVNLRGRLFLLYNMLIVAVLWGYGGIALHEVHGKNAPPQGSFRVEPAFVEIDVSTESDTQYIPVRYSNLTETAVDVELAFSPVRFADHARMTLLEKPSTLQSHILPSAQSFVVGPMETKTVLLSLQNLDLLSSSDYYEALVATVNVREKPDVSGGASIFAQITTVLLVHNTTSDRVPQYVTQNDRPLSEHLIFAYPQHIPIALTNTGTTYGIPRGTMRMLDVFGGLLATGSINPDSVRIFPHSTRIIDISMRREAVFAPIALGRFELKLYDEHVGERAQLTDGGMFLFVDPIFLMFVVVFAVVSVLFLMYVSRVRRKSY